MDLTHLEPYFDRSRSAAMGLVIESDEDEQPFHLGSGVLVRLGGREFILTAGHNVWSSKLGRRLEIAVGRPPDAVTALVHPGNGSAGAIHHPLPASPREHPEPDVAVIELTDKTVLLPMAERRPYLEDEIAFFDTNVVVQQTEADAAGRELVVTGFPSRFAQLDDGLVIDANHGTRGALSVAMVSMRVSTIPSFARKDRFAKEPREGRGIHIYFSTRMEDQAGTGTPFESPVGLSGGPVVAPHGDGVLVGLMRGAMDFMDGWDEWCEPAAEAVRLLVDHDNAHVAAAAMRVWRRYEEARQAGT